MHAHRHHTETTLTEETTAELLTEDSPITHRAADGRGDPASSENSVPEDHRAKPPTLRERTRTPAFKSAAKERKN